MNQLSKRRPLFSRRRRVEFPLLKGFHAKQRTPVVLAWNEKPQPGVRQPMPPQREAS